MSPPRNEPLAQSANPAPPRAPNLEGAQPGVRERTCEIEGCSRPVESGTLCAAHRKRRYRGKPLNEPLRATHRAPKAELLDAVLAVADANAEDDAEWTRAWNALERAALALARSRGWEPRTTSPWAPALAGACP